MKRLFLFLLLAPLAAFTACSSDDDDNGNDTTQNSLTASPATLSFDFNGGDKTFAITANVSWTATSSDDTWCTVSAAEGTGDATITVTAASWNGDANRTATITVTGGGITKSVSVTQTPEEEIPGKATIQGDDTGATSVILTATSEHATSFVWYNGTTVISGATTASYTVTASGTYYVEGKNSAGTGVRSEGKTVTIGGGPGETASLEDYIGEYTFSVKTTTDLSTYTSKTYADYLYDATEYGGESGEMFFINACEEYTNYETAAYIDFLYNTDGTASYQGYSYDYEGSGSYLMMFTALVTDGESIGFVFEFDIELNTATGQIAFPTTLTSSALGEGEAHYIVFVWDASTYEPLGYYSDYYIKDVVATKVGSRASSPTDKVVKVPVKLNKPAFVDANEVVKNVGKFAR